MIHFTYYVLSFFFLLSFVNTQPLLLSDDNEKIELFRKDNSTYDTKQIEKTQELKRTKLEKREEEYWINDDIDNIGGDIDRLYDKFWIYITRWKKGRDNIIISDFIKIERKKAFGDDERDKNEDYICFYLGNLNTSDYKIKISNDDIEGKPLVDNYTIGGYRNFYSYRVLQSTTDGDYVTLFISTTEENGGNNFSVISKIHIHLNVLRNAKVKINFI